MTRSQNEVFKNVPINYKLVTKSRMPFVRGVPELTSDYVLEE